MYFVNKTLLYTEHFRKTLEFPNLCHPVASTAVEKRERCLGNKNSAWFAQGVLSPVFGEVQVFGPLVLPLFHFRYNAPSSSYLAISSSPKDILIHSWHWLTYLRLLPESVAFSHINSISGNFSFLSVPYTFSPFFMVHSLMALEKTSDQCALMGT